MFLKHVFTSISCTLLPCGAAPILCQGLTSFNKQLMGATGHNRVGIEANGSAGSASNGGCQELVAEKEQKVLDNGTIKDVDLCPDQFVSRSSRRIAISFRPVVNLRLLNQFMATSHFKMESLVMLKDLLRPGDCQST